MKGYFKPFAIIIGALLLFLGGYVFGKSTSDQVTREIWVGDGKDGETDVQKVITDLENQAAVDNLSLIYAHRESIDTADVDINNPDLYVAFNSPKQSALLVESRLWLNDKGAVIAERTGETWDEVDYSTIPVEDALYIQSLLKNNNEE
ncbi:hypothetical protein LZP85_09740 [Priestia flexa]|uniref:Uncharacterized protein n=1 Tax=Priestia flexa TaxID=86664 RepID=A0A8I1SP94_9BACI|nr:hypothetical protein [Priestia flexa]MBN8252171.1 hypothetical protein [Priestia flexa]MBN8435116.1 hypothetical protein [Priestia flexa]MCA0967382.1 hypothetical protein [Priestia flexa]RIV15276.1 hypothetical protein D1859_01870 [Priestia flexa]UIR32018.1 hypothetical protein LZP85_09740 [Priestia flexa]